MQILNLTPQTEEEKLIFNSLQPMVSAELADKINNGVYIEKDRKRLLNKKTLSTFMVYLCEEAYKLISKDAPKQYNPNCLLITSEWFGFIVFIEDLQ